MNEKKDEFGRRAEEIKETVKKYDLENYVMQLLSIINNIKKF
jgi:molecular chaperone GrpE (heat shock protein)